MADRERGDFDTIDPDIAEQDRRGFDSTEPGGTVQDSRELSWYAISVKPACAR